MSNIPQLSDAEWQELAEKLAMRAAWKFIFYGWSKKVSHHTIAPGGISPADIVQKAIADVFDGKRIYNKNAYPSFYAFLRSVVDSLTSNLYKKIRRQQTKEVRIPQKHDSESHPYAIGLKSTAPDPAGVTATSELYLKVKNLLTEELANDRVVMGVLECLEAGINKRSEMADYLDVNMQEIDNARKRLQRVIEKKLHRYKAEATK